MLDVPLIQDFLKKKRIAVVGVSRNRKIPANYIFEKFISCDYEAHPINPLAEEINGHPAYFSLKDLPEKPEAVFMAGTPEVSEKTMKDCIDLGVRLVWMHRGLGPGSYSKKAEQLGKQNDIGVISNGCPMMFLTPDGFHKVLRWFKKF
jgi:hypothetical protein